MSEQQQQGEGWTRGQPQEPKPKGEGSMTDATDVQATNETDLLRDQIARLEQLLAAPPLKLSASGGGVPQGITGEQVLLVAQALLVPRDEVSCVLNRLRGALATREHLGW